MKQKLHISIFFLFISYATSFAQQAVVTGGGDISGSGGTMSFTVGQIDYVEAKGPGGSTSQGTQQVYIEEVNGQENKEILLVSSVYPNPSDGSVSLQILNQDLTAYSYNLTDANGKLFRKEAVKSELVKIDLQEKAPGTYFLNVYQQDRLLKTFKLIKK